MKINLITPVKFIAASATSIGVGTIVGHLVHAVIPDNLNRYQRITVAVGSYALGGVLGDLAGQYVSKQIDDLVAVFKPIDQPEEVLLEDEAILFSEEVLFIPEGETEETVKEEIKKRVVQQKGTTRKTTINPDEAGPSK